MAKKKTAKKAAKKSARGKKLPAKQRKPLKFMASKNDSDVARFVAHLDGWVDPLSRYLFDTIFVL